VSTPNRLILGTRGSALARTQSGHVADALMQLHEGLTVELKIVKTEGDQQTDRPFGPGDRGVFVKTIEQALLAGEIDFAVHSLKDLPSGDTDGLVLAAIPEREDPRDALVTVDGASFADLPRGATVGTGSPRRRSQILVARPDLVLSGLRGNIDTRASRVGDDLDAVVLAVAGLSRLGLDRKYAPIDPEVCIPAAGQGALAVQSRADDASTIACLAAIDHAPTRRQVDAERAFLTELGGGCMAPATAWAHNDGDGLRIDAMVAELDGGGRYVETATCTLDEGPEVGRRLARRLIERGAQDWIEAARGA
jgi:hydroxymethylbilane synthase